MVRTGFAHIFAGRSILQSRFFALVVVLGAVSVSATGAVFKCAGEGGTPVYQEVPCPSGKELRNFDRDPPPLTIVPGGIAGANAPDSARDARRPAARSAPAKPERSAKAERSPKAQRDPAERRHAHAGMTEGEVLARLGRPDITAGAARKGKGRWTYLPAAGDQDTITTLVIERGVVVDVERKVVKR